VLVEGEPVQGPGPRRIFIFQEGGVFPWLTVHENIGFGVSPKRPVAERTKIIQHDTVDLPRLRDMAAPAYLQRRDECLAAMEFPLQ
jgi:ABC-type nitrate/sulfonate/bicarbonate transport system ATPase subunit